MQACSWTHGGAVGAVAVAEGDLAQQEVLFELGPLFAAGRAQLRVLALLAAAFDEGFVGGDEVLGEHGGVAAGGVEAEVAEQGRGDVQGEPGADEFRGEQAAEVVWGEPHGLPLSVRPAQSAVALSRVRTAKREMTSWRVPTRRANRCGSGCPWVFSWGS